MSAGGVRLLRVAAARTQQALGWAGLAGVGLLLASLIWLALGWQAHRMPVLDESAALAPAPAAESQRLPAPSIAIDLPRRNEVPLLLTQIQQSVVSQGLAWAAADYKLMPATETAPATLEVRCALKGSYPKLRAVLAQLLRSVPGLTVRDLAMKRVNIDVAEVQATLTLGVLLRDEVTTLPEGTGPGARP
ncbi:MAG: GspMb/PilO family protein [Rhizobacter sp.]